MHKNVKQLKWGAWGKRRIWGLNNAILRGTGGIMGCLQGWGWIMEGNRKMGEVEYKKAFVHWY